MQEYTVVTFYKFVDLTDLAGLQVKLLKVCRRFALKGTILLASEGINATIAGSAESTQEFCSFLCKINLFTDLRFHLTVSSFLPFHKLKIRIKKEIVTFKTDILDISGYRSYVRPEDWDSLIDDKQNTVVIDTRNIYEVAAGTFVNAVNPCVSNFADFKGWIRENLSRDDSQQIAMFCTGGIRCEKSVAYLKSLGHKNVCQLEGGILNYLSKTRNINNKWQGLCFIFDERHFLDAELRPVNLK